MPALYCLICEDDMILVREYNRIPYYICGNCGTPGDTLNEYEDIDND